MKKVKQISLEALGLNYHKHADFVVSSWQRGESAVPMLIVRLLGLMFTGSVFIWSVIRTDVYYLIYMTNWGLMLNTLTLLFGFLMSVCAVSRGIKDDGLPWIAKFYWFFYNVSVTVAFLITIFYWILLYDYSTEPNISSQSFWLDIATHGFNSFAVLVELSISNTPCRLLHFYQPLGVGLWYMIFSVIYYFAGGTDPVGNPYIYTVLDWSTPGSTSGLVAMTAAGVICLHLLHLTLACIRTSIANTCVKKIGHTFPFVPADKQYA